MLRRVLPLLAAPFLLSACAFAREPAPAVSTTPTAAYAKGMVSAADPRAAEAGAEMLRAGGSATDAAIATMLALTVVEPQSSGIGGGGFLVSATPDGKVETIDGRETAPGGATPRWLLDENGAPLPFRATVASGLSIGVPGNVALAAAAHRRHGRLAWARLFQPAIRLARGGWTVTPRLHDALRRAAETGGRDPAARALYYDAAGVPVPVGTLVRNPDLARTLERIARDGMGALHGKGAATRLATAIAADTPAGRAAMTAGDIATYRAKPRDPVCGHYRAYRICGMGPPSSGATTVLATLGQLERFDLAALGKDSPVAWHLIAESMRLAYADRERYLADSDFVPVPATGLVAPAYLAERARLIAPDRTLDEARAGSPPAAPAPQAAGAGPDERGTSHFVAIDRQGNVASYTSTIEGPFGSGLMFGGFYLNNELTDFSFVPDKDAMPVANRVEGGKRPRSSMSPTLVFGPDGRLRLAIGAAGGATIPAQVTKAIVAVIDWNLPAAHALALPVLFAPGGKTVFVEEGSALESLIPALQALGHAEVRPRSMPLKANAIEVRDGTLAGAADPRSEGRAVAE